MQDYRHAFIMVFYAMVYIALFILLEKRSVTDFHIIHTRLDDHIPFVEYFIIPYLLWFPYCLFSVAYFAFFVRDKGEYYRLSLNLIMGMSLFLTVSWLYPNAHQLRPAVFPRDNIFTDMVRILYAKDTPTNILPSIHVFNSLAIHTAIGTCSQLKAHKAIRAFSGLLCLLIILSTMFLKQHSALDVTLGTLIALIGYRLFYAETAYDRDRVPLRRATVRH